MLLNVLSKSGSVMVQLVQPVAQSLMALLVIMASCDKNLVAVHSGMSATKAIPWTGIFSYPNRYT